MKKLLTLLFSLMFIVSINALGVSGTHQEVKTKTEVLQTHDIVQVATLQIVESNNAVIDVGNLVLQKEQTVLNKTLNVDESILVNFLDKDLFIRQTLKLNSTTNYLNNVPLVLEPTMLANNKFITTTYNFDKNRRCLLLFSLTS